MNKILIALVVLLFVACQKETPEKAERTGDLPSNFTNGTFSFLPGATGVSVRCIDFSVNNAGGSPLLGHGVLFAKTKEMTIFQKGDLDTVFNDKGDKIFAIEQLSEFSPIAIFANAKEGQKSTAVSSSLPYGDKLYYRVFGMNAFGFSFDEAKEIELPLESAFVYTDMEIESSSPLGDEQKTIKVFDTDYKTTHYILAKDLFEDDYHIAILLNADNTKATVASQPAWSHPSYGTIYISGEGEVVDGVLELILTHSVPNLGNFGDFPSYFLLK